MKEPIGVTTVFQIFVLFVLLFTAIMCLTINHSNAFGMKDEIVNIIELLEGNYKDGSDLAPEIVTAIDEASYRGSGSCPDGYEGYNRNGVLSYNDAAVCIREVGALDNLNRFLTSELGDVSTADFLSGSYYQVIVFFHLDLPIIGQTFNLKTKGETRLMYK